MKDTKISKEAFDAWYDSYDIRTPQSLFDRELARKAWDAAMQSAEVQALRDALEGLLTLHENVDFTCDGDWDAARAALAAMEKQK